MSMIPFFGLFFVWIFLGLIVFIPFLIALIDILRNKFEGNNQLMWVLIIFLLPLLGPILYFIIGTKQKIK
jgi:hypothetical protein